MEKKCQSTDKWNGRARTPLPTKTHILKATTYIPMYRWTWHVYCYIKVKYKNKNIIHLMLPNCHKADSLTNYDYQRFNSTKSINLDRFRENLAVTLTLKIPIWIPRPIRKQFKGRKYQEDRSLASNWLLLRHAQHSPSSLQRLLVHRLQPLLWFVLI